MRASMARLSKTIRVTSKPVFTAPNSDYFYVELVRPNGHYTCTVKMAPAGDPKKSVVVATATAKTIREAERAVYERTIKRFPRFPRPPYVSRNSGASRTVIHPTRPSI